MQIKVYIDPNGDVTITALVGDLVPVAFSLDRTDQHIRRWFGALSKTEEGRHSEVERVRQEEPSPS